MTVSELICEMLDIGISPDADICIVDVEGQWWPTMFAETFDGHSLLIEACDHPTEDEGDEIPHLKAVE